MLVYVGFEVVFSQDGEEGIKKLKNQIPILLFCDVMMSKLDGYGFMEYHIMQNRNTLLFL